MSGYPAALALTLVSELLLLALLCALARRPLCLPLLIHLGTNLLTHPALWLLFPRLGGDPGTRLLLLELAVMALEGTTLATAGRLRPWPLAFALAAAVNLASWALGIWLL